MTPDCAVRQKGTFMRRVLTLFLSLLLLVPSGYGWNGFGHMAVAYVAYQHLEPQTRGRADKLVRLNPLYATWKKQLPAGLTAEQQNTMLFVIAATWPDQIRGDKTYQADGTEGGNRAPVNGGDENIGYSDKALHKYWHFVNTPISQDGTLVQPSMSPNAETQVKAFARALASHESNNRKSYDMVWLMHMVGDVHQPLHNATRFAKDSPNGDAGGNLVAINATACVGDSATELHALWDGAIGSSADPQIVMKVAAALPPQTVAATDQDVDVWIGESVKLAQTKAYVAPVGDGKGPFTIDQGYCDQVREVGGQRVALAGMRLANLLNANLK